MHAMHSTIRLAAVGLALTLATAARAQQPPAQPQQHVRGDVVALTGDTLEVKSRAGQDLKLKLPADAKVASVEKADLGSIGEGLFVGTTAVPQQDGTLRAVEVHLFPDSMRGTGEGHRPWDLQPGSTMTNATITAIKPGANDRTMTLRYKDGEKTIRVPNGVPIVTVKPVDRSLMIPGAKVIVTQQVRDGQAVATRAVVGRNGFAP